MPTQKRQPFRKRKGWKDLRRVTYTTTKRKGNIARQLRDMAKLRLGLKRRGEDAATEEKINLYSAKLNAILETKRKAIGNEKAYYNIKPLLNKKPYRKALKHVVESADIHIALIEAREMLEKEGVSLKDAYYFLRNVDKLIKRGYKDVLI